MLNLSIYRRNKNAYLPISNILLSNKSYELYDKIIKEFLNFFDSFNIDINFENKSIMCDFEHSLRAALNNNINNFKSLFFSFCKIYL